MIAGIIDVVLLSALIIMNIVMGSNYLALWFVLGIIADVLLAIGAKKANAGLMMFWIIIGMINIVFLFISWIALPIYYFAVIVVTSMCDGTLQNAISSGFDNLNNQQNASINNLNNPNNENSNNLNNLNNGNVVLDVDCKGAHELLATLFYIDMAFVLVLPIYYIYLWVVVKSHRENLAQEKIAA